MRAWCLLTGWLLAGGPALAQTLFTDVTDQIGPSLLAARSSAFGDYDSDDWPDLFSAKSLYSYTEGPQLALLHNEGDGRFTDQTDAQIQGELASQIKGGGAVFADYDNDGDPDLFVPVGAFKSGQPGRNMLLRNDRGVFQDVALEAGLTDVLPTDNALWLDYDRDGHLDLFTGNLACDPPKEGVRNRLYRNNGDGTFTDVTEEAGVGVNFETDTNCYGGSNGGMLAADLDDDGWPDLFVAHYGARNRLFLNNGLGGFEDVTNEHTGNPGRAWGVAMGDVDNDGDLDLLQTARAMSAERRSGFLRNLGGGEFEDATNEVGLSALTHQDPLGCALGDVDNDGALDLLTGGPTFFLNQGDGTFEEHTSRSGLGGVSLGVSLGDYDLDGFLDAWFCSGASYGDAGRLFRNSGNGNHWLRVELVGMQSNRSGIGARLIATAGDLRQTQEITGGMGFTQHELVAHFGLGQRAQVDRLEVRWPSGQVDELTDIPVDQKIRVVEGRGEYYPVVPASLRAQPLLAGVTRELEAVVRPALFEPGAAVTRMVADLSELGGAAEVLLEDAGDGSYRLRGAIRVAEPGLKKVRVAVEQVTSLGILWSEVSRSLAVRAGADLVVFADGPQDGGTVEKVLSADLDLAATERVAEGTVSLGVQTRGTWTVVCRLAEPAPAGYEALRFAFHPGDVSGRYFRVDIDGGAKVELWPGEAEGPVVDLERPEWQVVEIPLKALGEPQTIGSIRFSGNSQGTFYLDDIRLVAVRLPVTAVREELGQGRPNRFSLAQNYPNPFNGGTTIRYALPETVPVRLVVYSLAGQQVETLVDWVQPAGRHLVSWDGTDETGRRVGSGVYFYSLSAGGQGVTRRMVLAR